MAKKRKKPKLAPADIGIIHSGTSGRHDKHIKDLRDGIKLYSNTNARPARYARDRHGQLDSDAQALANLGVTALIAAGGTRSALAALNFGGGKPVIVTSVSSPSVLPVPRVAGVCARTTELDPVRLQLLCELVPGVTKIGALRCDSRPDAAVQKTILDNKALALGVGPLNYRSIDPNGTTQDADIERAFQEWKAAGVKAVIVTADPLFNNHMDTIVGAAAQRKIPAVYQWREFADQGGLMGYGPSLSLAYKIAGTFAGRIAEELATIEELPLLSLESCELVINLKAAKDLSLTVPPALLARATDVIVE